MILQKTKNSIYTSHGGDVFMIKSVDRQYASAKKKPVYYLSKLNKDTKQMQYISGLFKTDKEGLFSYDILDTNGIKKIKYLEFLEGGLRVHLVE